MKSVTRKFKVVLSSYLLHSTRALEDPSQSRAVDDGSNGVVPAQSAHIGLSPLFATPVRTTATPDVVIKGESPKHSATLVEVTATGEQTISQHSLDSGENSPTSSHAMAVDKKVFAGGSSTKLPVTLNLDAAITATDGEDKSGGTKHFLI